MGKVSDSTRCTRQGKQRIATYHEHFHRLTLSVILLFGMFHPSAFHDAQRSTFFFSGHIRLQPCTEHDAESFNEIISIYIHKHTYTPISDRSVLILVGVLGIQNTSFTSGAYCGLLSKFFLFSFVFSDWIICLYSWKVIVLRYGDDEQRITNRLLLHCDLSA